MKNAAVFTGHLSHVMFRVYLFLSIYVHVYELLTRLVYCVAKISMLLILASLNL